MSKWIRYTIPFIPAWILSVLARVIGKSEFFSLTDLLLDFIKGGYGAGSYYYPVILQIVLLMPLVIWLINRYKFFGLIGLFVINVSYEAIKTICGMSGELYRLLAFRYIFIVAYGCFLCIIEEKDNKNNIFSYIVGLIGFNILYSSDI